METENNHTIPDSQDPLTEQQEAQRKGKDSSSTFKSQKQAEYVVNPLLRQVDVLRRRLRAPFSTGWLNRLKSWLVRMERGSYADTRSPYFNRLNFQQIAKLMRNLCKQYAGRARRYLLGSLGYLTILIEVETAQAEKIGWRGHFPPASEWLDDKVEAVFSDKPPKPELDKAALDRALDWLAHLVAPGTIKVGRQAWKEGFEHVGTEQESEKTLDVTTNGCFAFYTKGYYVRADDAKYVSPALKQTSLLLQKQAADTWQYLWELNNWRKSKLLFVATASQRTNVASANGPDKDGSNVYEGEVMSKLRAVMAMPKVDTILGKPLLNRLLEVAREIRNPDGSRIFCALMHPKIIDKNMELVLQSAHIAGLTVLSTDFSAFDASVPPWLALKCAIAVSKWMDERTANIWLSIIKAEFYNTMCITTDKIFPVGPSSVKSGGITTNFIDSVVNLVSQRYGLETGAYKSIIAQIVQGDDALLLGEGVNPHTFESVVAQLGFIGNASKQFYEQDALSFCQKTYFRGIPGGIYPISRAVASCVSTEDDVPMRDIQEDTFKYVLVYRTLCRLDVACFNPYFVELVKLFMKEDEELHLGKDLSPQQIIALAGDYAVRMEREKFLKPHKAANRTGFEDLPVNRVVRGELPPLDPYERWAWVYGERWEDVAA